MKYTSFEAACQARGIDPSVRPDVSMIPEHLRHFITSTYEVAVIVEANNEGKRPNWNDSSKYKYAPWVQVKADLEHPEGLGFSAAGYGASGTNTSAGSRLLYLSAQDAEDAPTVFPEQYKGYLLG